MNFRGFILVLLTFALPCEGAETWRLLSETEIWRLSIDESTIRRRDDKVYFRYLLEHPVFYENKVTGRKFKSVTVNATIDCRLQTMAYGAITSYASAGTGGDVAGRAGVEDAYDKPNPIVKGGTDDILRRRVCRS